MDALKKEKVTYNLKRREYNICLDTEQILCTKKIKVTYNLKLKD
jgi:hypothetical protein